MIYPTFGSTSLRRGDGPPFVFAATARAMKNAVAQLARLSSRHWRFFRKTGVLRRKEVALVLGLSATTVFTEAAGMAMIAPLLGFVESGRDVVAFAESSPFAAGLVRVFETLGLPITLAALSIIAFLLVVTRQTINYFNTVQGERIKLSIGRRLSVQLFSLLLHSRREVIERHKPGEASVICDYEAQAAAAIMRVYATIWMTTLAFLAYGTIVLVAAPAASLFAGVVLAVVMLLLSVLIRRTKRLSEQSVVVRKEQVDFFTERFRAWKLIKLSGALEAEGANANDIATRYAQNRVDVAEVSARLILWFSPIAIGVLLTILYVFVDVLALAPSIILLFVLVMLRLIPLAQTYQKQLTLLAQFDPSLHRVDRVMRQARAEAEALNVGDAFAPPRRAFEFRDVRYAYPADPKRPVLRDVSVTIPAGRITALIGHSGSGKSTMIDLLSRLIEPTGGAVLADGRPLSDFSLASLRAAIAFVPQDPFVFDATVADNIRYQASAASSDEIESAARLARAHDFIAALPDGYDTFLGDGGGRLSGGQKQRIALARAFCARAPILILDEPTSALDAESEAAVQQSIETVVRESAVTAIVIAHRLSTIRNADLVVKLDDGRLAAVGSVADVLGPEAAA